jgi:hypothetical protein
MYLCVCSHSRRTSYNSDRVREITARQKKGELTQSCIQVEIQFYRFHAALGKLELENKLPSLTDAMGLAGTFQVFFQAVEARRMVNVACWFTLTGMFLVKTSARVYDKLYHISTRRVFHIPGSGMRCDCVNLDCIICRYAAL